MKFKKSTTKPNDDKIIISSKYFTNGRPSYICSFCNKTLTKLTDAGLNNSTYYCRYCNVEYDPESENIRRESKITVPDRNAETEIVSIDIANDISITHIPEPKGTFKALQQKGIKITDYKDDVTE